MKLSPIVAGVWRAPEWGLDAQGLLRWMEEAVALGITSFDHADIYGGYTVEAMFGAAMALSPALREQVQLVSKCGIKLVSPLRPGHRIKSYDSSRAHVLASVNASLAALRTDRIDLLLIHRPDLLMDPDELADTFRHLQAAGKVLEFGVSNHTPAQLAMLQKRYPLLTNQIEFSPLQMQALADGTLEQCVDLDIRPMAWSPLGGGRLLSGNDEQARRVRDTLEGLRGRYAGASLATLAYAWVMRHPSRPIPVTGTRRIEALREAMAATSFRLAAEDWYAVWQASIGHEVP
jgi:predicted oxidoreductase